MEKLDVKTEGLLGKVKKQPLWVKVLLGLVALLLVKEILLGVMVKNIFNEFHQFHQDFQREQQAFDERFDKALNDFEAKFQSFKAQQDDKINATEHFIEEKQANMHQPFNPEA